MTEQPPVPSDEGLGADVAPPKPATDSKQQPPKAPKPPAGGKAPNDRVDDRSTVFAEAVHHRIRGDKAAFGKVVRQGVRVAMDLLVDPDDRDALEKWRDRVRQLPESDHAEAAAAVAGAFDSLFCDVVRTIRAHP